MLEALGITLPDTLAQRIEVVRGAIVDKKGALQELDAARLRSLLDFGVKDGVALTFTAGLQDNEPHSRRAPRPARFGSCSLVICEAAA
jgi:hypothetical protein